MNAYQKFMANGIMLAALVGCSSAPEEDLNVPQKQKLVKVCVPYNENYTTSQSGIATALGDVDGDGLTDLIVASPSSVKYFKNLGTGKFREAQKICTPYNENYTTSQSGVSVSLGDIDNDKDLDLVVASPSSVRLYINQNGRFIPQLE